MITAAGSEETVPGLVESVLRDKSPGYRISQLSGNRPLRSRHRLVSRGAEVALVQERVSTTASSARPVLHAHASLRATHVSAPAR